MAQEHVYTDTLAKTSVLTNCSWLRQYDAYPLDCPQAGITYRIICTIVDWAFPFSLYPTGTQRSPVNLNISKHFGDPSNNNGGGSSTAMASLFKMRTDKTARQYRYPYLLEMASSSLSPPTSSQGGGCALDKVMAFTLEQTSTELLQECKQDHELKIFMDPVNRLRMMAVVLQNMPYELVKRAAELPALFLVFLIHCDPDTVQRSLRFWPHSPPCHPIAGFWFGLPNMVSESTCSATARSDYKLKLNERYSLLAGIYCYLSERLFQHRALVKHLDGLLHSCLDAILCTAQRDVREVFVYDKSTSMSAAGVLQGNNVIHSRMREEIHYLRAILKGAGSSVQISGDLMRALRVGMTLEELRERHPECVQERKRVWQGKVYRGGVPAAEVRKKLVDHDCASRLAEFDAFYEKHHTQDNPVICFEIDDATADAVLSPLQQSNRLHIDAFVAQVVDLQHGCRVYLALSQSDYYGYSRWGMYRVREQYIEDSKTLLPGSKWIPYAFAPTVTQLLNSQSDKAHLRLGIDILRKWAGLKVALLNENDQGDIVQILDLLHILLQHYRPEEVVQVLPLLLSFRPVPDELDIGPEVKTTHAGIQHKMQSIRDPSKCLRHLDKSRKYQIWHLFMEYLQELVTESKLEWSQLRSEYLAQFVCRRDKSTEIKEDVYQKLSLCMQASQVKDTLKPTAKCSDVLWPLLAAAEQLYHGVVHKKPVMAVFGCNQAGGHQCARYFDAPIAWTKSTHGCKVIYHDSYFPVWTADMTQNPSLEVNDRFAFFHSKYGDWITPSMVENVLRTKCLLDTSQQLDFRWHTRQDEDLRLLTQQPSSSSKESKQKRKSPEPPTPEYMEEEEVETKPSHKKKTKVSPPTHIPSTTESKRKSGSKQMTLTLHERTTKTLVVSNPTSSPGGINNLTNAFVGGYGSMDGMQAEEEDSESGVE